MIFIDPYGDLIIFLLKIIKKDISESLTSPYSIEFLYKDCI